MCDIVNLKGSNRMDFKLDVTELKKKMETGGISPASVKAYLGLYKRLISDVFDKVVPSVDDHVKPENLQKIKEYVLSDKIPLKKKHAFVHSYKEILKYLGLKDSENCLELFEKREGDYEDMRDFDLDLSDIRAKMEAKSMKENSILQYLSSYKRIVHDAFVKERPKNEDLNKKEILKKVLDYIRSDKVKVHRKPVLAYSYITILKCLGIRLGPNNVLVKECKALKRTADNEDQHREFTPEEKQKEIDRYVPMEELKKLRDKWKGLIVEDFSKADTNYLILSCYTLQVPLRSQCYYDAYYFEDASKEDTSCKIYFDKKTKKLIETEHKTIKSIGKVEIDVDDELCELFNSYHVKCGNLPWLVCTERKKKFTQVNFSCKLKSLTGGKVGSTGIRNMFCSELNQNDKIPTSVKKLVAKQMGHSYQVSQMCYTKGLKNGIVPNVEQIKPDSDALTKENQQLLERINKLEAELDTLKQIPIK